MADLPSAGEGAGRIGFLLLPDFPMMSYACAVEPLRAANTIAGRRLYDWRHFSLDGGPVFASNGVSIVPDGKVGDPADLDLLLVCAGGNPASFDHAPTYGWLRGLSRHGVALGGISGGPYVLARAGLLDGRRATIHWEHLAPFTEAFPALDVTGTVFEIAGDRMTSAGGVAVLDMMIALISQSHGAALGVAVGDWFLRRELAAGGAPQRIDPRDRFGVRNPRLLRVLVHMEAHVGEPLDRAALARLAGVSLRRLEGLFAEQMSTTIARHAFGLRLERARALLRQSAMPVTEIAAACGFASPSHFSRAYRARFGTAPTADR
ncbi:GlxA family transcriptional regulator [Methylobrevis pamukkalensis]|uniref:HTH-type transcriptional regulator CdhR n=1 Tax=Methylobrevis pamukkalensis TaxID=1439726 RepID=A0A1E3GYY9_9HYPH|nr:GlxA family transcriptional regulator [Methylobrevis pamukkalensis]ODN69252.1 HTH-type transcriptional regulator CdhR [Methylobrevis pamukkalensis]